MPQDKRRQRLQPRSKTSKKRSHPTAPLPDRMNLKSVRMVETHALLKIAGGTLPSPKMAIHTEANFGASVAEKTIIGNLKVTMSPAPEGDNEDASPASSVTVTVVMQCIFDVDEMPDMTTIPEAEIQVVNQTITLVAWAYVRQHIAMLTTSMGIPAFTLPLMRVKLPERSPE